VFSLALDLLVNKNMSIKSHIAITLSINILFAPILSQICSFPNQVKNNLLAILKRRNFLISLQSATIHVHVIYQKQQKQTTKMKCTVLQIDSENQIRKMLLLFMKSVD
jgi:hypothetical protein